jgi:FkbM family methyltransferase
MNPTLRKAAEKTAEGIGSICPSKVARPIREYVRNRDSTHARGILAYVVNFNLIAKPQDFTVTTRFGYHMSGNTEDAIQRYIYLFGVWEPQLTSWIRERLSPGDTFIDVGANVGYYSLLAASCVGTQGRVVAVEVSPGIFATLNENLRRNGLGDRVRVVNEAASDRPMTVSVFAGPKQNIGKTTTVPQEGFEVEASMEARPLADMLTAEEMANARLIKIDVEGLEGPVVRGLMPALAACREDLEVIVEVEGQPTPEGEMTSDIVTQFAELGFNVYEVTNYYDPWSYVIAERRSERPRRVIGPLEVGRTKDLIFSRIDAPTL